MLRFLLLSALLLSSVISPAKSHGDHGDGGDGSCEADPNIRLTAEFRPGLVTVDGQPDEWAEVEGSKLSLLPALDPDADKAYPSGKITVKVLTLSCSSSLFQISHFFFFWFLIRILERIHGVGSVLIVFLFGFQLK